MLRRLASRALLCGAMLLLGGCRRSEQSSGAPPGSGSASAKAPSPGGWGKAPVAARRTTPPPTYAQNALAVGAKAPPFTLLGSGGSWSLVEGLAKTTHVILVFYRGDW
jgi:hypothetical protein